MISPACESARSKMSAYPLSILVVIGSSLAKSLQSMHHMNKYFKPACQDINGQHVFTFILQLIINNSMNHSYQPHSYLNSVSTAFPRTFPLPFFNVLDAFVSPQKPSSRRMHNALHLHNFLVNTIGRMNCYFLCIYASIWGNLHSPSFLVHLKTF